MDMLKSINDRLTVIEENDNARTTQESDESDKESEPATPTSLARDKTLSAKVRGRMTELNLLDESEDAEQDAHSTNKSRGNKSGRSKTIQDIVIREIDWPQYHVYRGVDRRPARYEDLNIQEFVYGVLCQVIDGKDSKANKNTMLQHLRMLMGDA